MLGVRSSREGKEDEPEDDTDATALVDAAVEANDNDGEEQLVCEADENSTVLVDELDKVDPEPVDTIHRLSWKDGTMNEMDSPLRKRRGVWAATFTNKDEIFASNDGSSSFSCEWDRLFADQLSTDESAIDQLLHLLEQGVADVEDGRAAPYGLISSSSSTSRKSVVQWHMLSPRGKHLAETLEERMLSSSPSRQAAIESVCPNWRENLQFAFAQHDREEIELALARIKRARGKLVSAVENTVVLVTKRHDAALEQFEVFLWNRSPFQGAIWR